MKGRNREEKEDSQCWREKGRRGSFGGEGGERMGKTGSGGDQLVCMSEGRTGEVGEMEEGWIVGCGGGENREDCGRR